MSVTIDSIKYLKCNIFCFKDKLMICMDRHRISLMGWYACRLTKQTNKHDLYGTSQNNFKGLLTIVTISMYSSLVNDSSFQVYAAMIKIYHLRQNP